MKKIITLALSILLFSSCNHFIMKSGSVEIQESKSEIPVEFRLGLPIIQVNINGKSYDFLFDTGAINVISEKLYKELDLKTRSRQIIRDSQKKKSVLRTVKLDTIFIGENKFIETGAIVADLNQSVVISCLNIDGIIGSNLMKLAYWEIDYKNQKLSISNNKNIFKIPEKADIMNFKTSSTGKVYIDVTINGITETNVTFDTGSNSGINCSKRTFNKLEKSNLISHSNYGYGSNMSGLYGAGSHDTTFYMISDTLKVNEIICDNQIIQFKQKGSSTIGNEFLRNYRIIMDWNNNEISLIKDENIELDSMSNFGFKSHLKNNQLFVKYIFNNSSAQKEGLQIGDHILKIDDNDYSKTEKNCFCNIIENGFSPEKDSIKVTVLRNEQEINFNLVRNTIL